MGDYTSNLFFFKPPLGARGLEQKRLFDLSLDQVDDRLGKEIWVGDPQFVWHADPFERLKNAVSGLDTALAILRIPPETYLISESYSIPGNITVVLERGAIFQLDNGVSLTLEGGAAAGPYQIFAGEGTVLFGKPVEIFSEWWGLPGWSSPEGNITAPLGSRYVKTLGTPPLYYIKNGDIGNTGWQAIGADGGGGTGVSNFTELYDTPSSFTGQSGKVVRVNAVGNALEFGNADHSHANQANLEVINQDLASTSSPTFAGLEVNGNLTVSGTVDGVDVASHQSRHEAGGPDALEHQNLAGAGTRAHAEIDTHLDANDNPHSVTAAQVGAIADAADTVKDTHIDWGTGSGQVSADHIPDGGTKIIPTAAQESNWDSHLSSTTNPHSISKEQIGLGNVSDDAQLKRAGNDWLGFTEEPTPESGDVLLLEKVTTGAKRKVLIANLPTGGGGEANTASNQGAGGVGLFRSKVGIDLQFKNINSGSNKITITDDPVNSEVDIDVAPDNIDHQSLAGAGSNTHAQIDAHLSAADNPHGVSAAQAGALADGADTVQETHIDWGTGPGQVSADHIPDGGTKIIPTAAQESNWDSHLSDTANPHSVSKDQVGLGNLSNEAQVKKAASSVDGNLLVWVGTTGDAVMDAGAKPGDFAAATHHHDALYAPLAQGVTNGNAHDHAGGDGAPIDHANVANAGSNSHAQLDAHVASSANPHGTTAAQVGLGNVSNDAQLKRAAGDLTTFPEKTSPASADVLVIEDSAEGYAKKRVQVGNLPTGSGGSTTFTGLSDTPASFSGQGSKVLRVNAAENAIEFTDKHLDVPLVNNSCSPLVQISATAGEDLNQWDVVYLNADGKYYKADASSGATMPAVAVATAPVTANNPGSFMLLGLLRDDAKSWTIGAPLYLDTVAGTLTQSAPSGGTAVVQVVGVALTPTIGWINPHLNFAGWFC